MSLRLSKKTANDTGYDGLVKTLRRENPGHLNGFLIHTVPPTLSEIGRKKKVPVPTIAPLGHIHIRNNTAKGKKQESLASASGSESTVAFKRPSENRDAASASKPPVSTTPKRKRSTPSGSVDNAAEDPASSRRKRFAAAVESTPNGGYGRQSTVPAHAPLNRKGRPTNTRDLPSHPPLEEIGMWVPTPNAKFGPPKRKRTAGERRDPAKEGHVDIAVPAETPVPTPLPLPSSSRPLSLTESQIFALREEEEESQPTSKQPDGTINDSATGDPLPPTVRAKDDIHPTKPNANNGHGSETSDKGAHSQSKVPDPIKQVLGVANDSTGYRFNPLLPSPLSSFHPNPSTSPNSSSKSPQVEKPVQVEGVNTEDTHPFKPQIPVFNFKPPANTISSSRSSQIVKIGPPRTRKPGTSSTKQHSPSKSELPRTGKETLANRRAFEARARLNELRRAGKKFEEIAAKGHPALETSQSSERQPGRADVFSKLARETIESSNGSQVTRLGNSANEISASASPGGNRKVGSSKSQEDIIMNKSGQDVNMGSVSRTGGVLAAKVLVVRDDVATAPC